MRKFVLLMGVLFTSILLSCSQGSSGNSNTTSPQLSSSNIIYTQLKDPSAGESTSTFITGIRQVTDSTNVYMSGVFVTGSSKVGLLYTGPVLGGGTWESLSYPSSDGVTVTNTELYGPNSYIICGDIGVQLAGSYNTVESGARHFGLFYQGPVDGSGSWRTINPQPLESRPVTNTIARSVMGGYVVGNYATDLLAGKAFLYKISNESFVEIKKPGALSTTAYGIWSNGDGTYTIAGGYSNTHESGIDIAYIVNWNAESNVFSNWASYSYNNAPSTVTHFEGITTDSNGGYNLVAEWMTESGLSGSSFVHIPRNESGQLGNSTWTNVSYPNSSFTSANTVYESYALGAYQLSGGLIINSYVATILQ